MNIKRLREAGNVQRFHTLRMIIPEDVAKHSFNLAHLLMWVTKGQASRNLILYALSHDMGEYVTGDIPSPVKKVLWGNPLQGMEDAAAFDACPWAAENRLTVEEVHIFKLCDNLDGLLKCAEEYQMGNPSIRSILLKYLEYVEENLNHVDLETDDMVYEVLTGLTEELRHECQ